VRQHHGAAHHLIGVLGIDPESNRQRDGFIKFRELDFLHERQRIFQRVGPVFNQTARRRVFLAVSSHKTPWWSCRLACARLPLTLSVPSFQFPVQSFRYQVATRGLNFELGTDNWKLLSLLPDHIDSH
jgi:hypothetical protein